MQRLVRPAKVGHAGTLDPLAGGVLVVCVGAATRLIEYVQRMPKSYTGTFLLGRSSPTEDVAGEVTELANPPVPSLEQIAAAAAAFCGQIEQRPPAFSALKLAGQPAYKLARKGRYVELQPRTVVVYRLEVLAYDYPQLTLAVECGGGTYIRSLGRDLAERLGTAAVMSALTRTAIGGFHLDQAIEPHVLTPDSLEKHLWPPLRAVESLPRVELSAEEIVRIRNGLPIARDLPIARETAAPGANEIAALDQQQQLIAILTPRGPGLLGPLRNLLANP